MDDGTLIADACPENMYCLGVNTDATLQNSPFCVPLCADANDFCLGFQCPSDYPFSVTGNVCVDDAEATNQVCSCLKQA